MHFHPKTAYLLKRKCIRHRHRPPDVFPNFDRGFTTYCEIINFRGVPILVDFVVQPSHKFTYTTNNCTLNTIKTTKSYLIINRSFQSKWGNIFAREATVYGGRSGP